MVAGMDGETQMANMMDVRRQREAVREKLVDLPKGYARVVRNRTAWCISVDQNGLQRFKIEGATSSLLLGDAISFLLAA